MAEVTQGLGHGLVKYTQWGMQYAGEAKAGHGEEKILDKVPNLLGVSGEWNSYCDWPAKKVSKGMQQKAHESYRASRGSSKPPLLSSKCFENRSPPLIGTKYGEKYQEQGTPYDTTKLTKTLNGVSQALKNPQ